MNSAVYLADPDCTLHHGDVLQVLAELADESVDCVVTSPPYWGLRDYGTGAWEGGDKTCDHDQRRRENDPDSKSATDAGAARDSLAGKEMCRKCGARRVDQQIGLEPTPDAFVASLVEVFREVRRVLAPHGTCWVNLGDSYASGGENRNGKGSATLNEGRSDFPVREANHGLTRGQAPGLKPKDLVGVPWRVAFALQADGWWLRSDIVWAKPNPMPESVTDRPTKSHEYVFLLTKRPTYWFDQEAVRESNTPDMLVRAANGHTRGIGTRDESRGDQHTHAGTREILANGRNVRSVWTIATQPYPEAHFATYPEELVRRCILAGCKPGGVVLDPFVGSGTTCKVARDHGRHSIGIDLNQEYLELAATRLQQLSLLSPTIGTH